MRAKYIILALTFFVFLFACQSQGQTDEGGKIEEVNENYVDLKDPVAKSEAEWKKVLSQEEYYVLREKGTERAFSGKYNDYKEHGVFTCAACGNPLFSSETKFDSGTGWPSFYKPINKKNVKEVTDKNLGMHRTEVLCNRCNGHLGHVFPDGQEPTGLRYCINSVALNFRKNKK